jgi:hypothetical protein
LIKGGGSSCTKETTYAVGPWVGTGANFTIVDTPGFQDSDQASPVLNTLKSLFCLYLSLFISLSFSLSLFISLSLYLSLSSCLSLFIFISLSLSLYLSLFKHVRIRLGDLDKKVGIYQDSTAG